MSSITLYYFFFFFNDTATTEIYTLSLHDALPIFLEQELIGSPGRVPEGHWSAPEDRPTLPKCLLRARSRSHASDARSEEHTSELQSRQYLVCRLLLEKKKKTTQHTPSQLLTNSIV